MPPLQYLDFDLQIEREGDRFAARVLRSPAGEALHHFRLPFSPDRLENLVLKLGTARKGARKAHTPEMEAAQELGGQLFEAVFGGDVRACFKSSRDEAAAEEGRGLRIKIRLQEVPELADIPWEFLFDASLERFFAQSNETPIVRYIAMPERVRPLTVPLPLRILGMIASPSDYPRLDVKREKASIEQALRQLISAGKVHLEWLKSATLTALHHRSRQQDFHIFHYIGHGGFERHSEEGVLVLEDEHRHSWLAGAHRVGTALHDCPKLRLAVLNACEGARNSKEDPFGGLAATLVRQGIPAVVAMQFEISDEAAITFSREFYTAIAEGFPVDAALAEARKAIYLAPNDVEWGTPVLYMRSPDGVLFDLTHAGVTAGEWVGPVSVGSAARPAVESVSAPEREQPTPTSEQEALKPQTAELTATPKQDQVVSQKTLRHIAIAAIAILSVAVAAVIGLWKQQTPPTPPSPPQVQPAAPTPPPFRKEEKPARTETSPQVSKEEKTTPAVSATANAKTDYYRGEQYYYGRGVKQDYAQAAAWYRKAADQGNADAQTKLGGMYGNGLGVPQDDAEAVRWYRKAADQGHADAQYDLGWMYANGTKRVPRDVTKAVELYRKAAAQGHTKAQFELARMYFNGKGVPRDDAKAAAWFRKAADQGNADAQWYLGGMYGNGLGVPRDDAKAVEWFRKAADQGIAAAQFNLGVGYATGRGVPQDDAKAVEWYRKAADQGHADAQYDLGVRYGGGKGVPQDDAKAVEWYRKAAAQGHPKAQAILREKGLAW